MLDVLAHRGPDGRGLWMPHQRAAIGSVRLAIRDYEFGNQPLFDEKRVSGLVANGEVYNAETLRSKLEKLGHSFRSQSDSEVMLHLFEDEDVGAFRQLDGMFALAIATPWRLVLARDPMGIKPLYYAWNGKLGPKCRIAFASEMKALVGQRHSVRPLMPGEVFDSDRGISRFWSYDNKLYEELEGETTETLAGKLRELIERAVASHLMSDRPVGILLSGGLDSSIVAYVASRHQKPLHTFSVGVAGSSDLQAARVVAQVLGTFHHEYVLDGSALRPILPKIAFHLESYDHFVANPAIPMWFACAFAACGGENPPTSLEAPAKHGISPQFPVLLVGEGADELFGGYDHVLELAKTDLEAARREMERSVRDLHWINLQRVDRVGMAHGVECRVPFLQRDVVAFARAVPTDLLLRRDPYSGHWIGKYLLRRAFEDALPPEIIWGEKRQFSEGAGFPPLFQEIIQTDRVWLRKHRRRYRHLELKSSVEILFHSFLKNHFGNDPSIWNNVARYRKLLRGEYPQSVSRSGTFLTLRSRFARLVGL